MAKVVGAKGYIQRRRPAKNGWSVAKRALFLDMLAATCNVTEAARAAGMTVSGARSLRSRDAEFALLWAEAFLAGEERLREELIGAALGQVSSGYNPSGERVMVENAPFNPELAIKVLQMRSGGGSGRRRRTSTCPSQAEVDAALLAQLDRLGRSLPAQPGQPDQPQPVVPIVPDLPGLPSAGQVPRLDGPGAERAA